MPEKPTLEELIDRVRQSKEFYGGAALDWHGYFASMLEWRLISVSAHDVLTQMLPEVPNNPVIWVFLGWQKDEQERRSEIEVL